MFEVWGIDEWIMLIYIAISGIFDLRYRGVPSWYLGIGTIGSVWCQIMYQKEVIPLIIFGGLTGILFLAISKYTKEGIGYGDSWMILNLGIYLGIWKLLAALGIAFMCTAILAGAGMASHICKRKTRLPFLPFLLLGYLGIYGW